MYFNLVKIVIGITKHSWENIKTNLKEKEYGHIAESSDSPPILVACCSKSGVEHVSWKGWNVEQKETSAFQAELAVQLTLRRLMSYIYGAPILDVSRSHTTTQHSR